MSEQGNTLPTSVGLLIGYGKAQPVYTAEQMKEYGEACRAAGQREVEEAVGAGGVQSLRAPAAPQVGAAPARVYPVVPKWLADLVGEYGVAGGREPNAESAVAWGRLVRGINQFARESIDAALAAAPEVAAPWIPVADRLPEVDSWVNVLIDHAEGDWFHRRSHGEGFAVVPARLRSIDSEGYARWERWRMADGGPMGIVEHVTHWMPLPAPPANRAAQAAGAKP